MVAEISAPVPDSAAASQRTCGNAPARVPLEGRPKCSALALLSATSLLEPSIETTRSPAQNTPAASPSAGSSGPVGPATASNSMCSGSEPSRVRARDSAEMSGRRQRRPSPASTQPSGSIVPASSSWPRRR